MKKHHFIHELGYMSNLSPNYERVIASGLLAAHEEAERIIDAILDLTSRYQKKAVEEGNNINYIKRVK